MKNKKIIAIALCVGIVVSSFSGYVTGYTKFEPNEFTAKKLDASLDNSGTSTLPPINVIEINAEDMKPENNPNKIVVTSDDDGEILYKGTKSTLDPDSKDMFNIGEEEIEAMMQEGYSVEDIFEADKISNETGIEPEMLLEKKAETNKSLEEIKKDILEESREKTFAKLKETYKKEYDKLKSKKLKESEIMNLLAYTDINNVKVTDELITAYQKSGDELFSKPLTEKKESQLSQEKIKEYKLTNTEAESLSEDILTKLEVLAQKTGRSVEELVKAYIEGTKHMNK